VLGVRDDEVLGVRDDERTKLLGGLISGFIDLYIEIGERGYLHVSQLPLLCDNVRLIPHCLACRNEDQQIIQTRISHGQIALQHISERQ
jgi:hypothetical protein